MATRVGTDDPEPWSWTWALLPLRFVLFALIQGAFALALGSWDTATAWWPIVAAFANLVTIGLLIGLTQGEANAYSQLFAPAPLSRSDWLVLGGVIVVGAPLAFLPNIWVADWLFGNPEAALDLLVRPLPLWAAVMAIAFPLTIVFAELPFYFGFLGPRLERQTSSVAVGVVMPALFLALQHVALPLIFDASFMLWRGLMFLPFAIYVGAVLRWRPKFMPYLAIVHGLLDLSVVTLLFTRIA